MNNRGFAAGFYVGRYKSNGESYALTIGHYDVEELPDDSPARWFYLFDFPEDLEDGFATILEDKYFQIGVFHD